MHKSWNRTAEILATGVQDKEGGNCSYEGVPLRSRKAATSCHCDVDKTLLSFGLLPDSPLCPCTLAGWGSGTTGREMFTGRTQAYLGLCLLSLALIQQQSKPQIAFPALPSSPSHRPGSRTRIMPHCRLRVWQPVETSTSDSLGDVDTCWLGTGWRPTRSGQTATTQ